MKGSKGLRSGTRYKFKKKKRPGMTNPITRMIQRFEKGDKVHIIVDPSIHKGQPHHRFHGKTGEVIGKRGKCYLISVRDGNKEKIVISRPEHLRPQKQ